MCRNAWAVLSALTVLCLIGCETIPQHEVPEMFPASGMTGIRTGAVFQQNFSTDTLPYDDCADFWERGAGFAIEFPIDASPYWGGFFGVGYEHYRGESTGYTYPDGSTDTLSMDSIDLVPFYVGLTARIPTWLDEEQWEQEQEPEAVWIPNEPVGFAPYVKGSVGGAILTSSPDVVNSSGEDFRAFDYQIFPFLEGSGGVEYRSKSIGYWIEGGYRFYIIPDRENGGFGSDRMAHLGGLRIMVGLTWYLR